MTLRTADTNSLRLEVRDDGIGLPKDFDLRRAGSLGLQLVSDLARQMGGVLSIEPQASAAISVTFARLR